MKAVKVTEPFRISIEDIPKPEIKKEQDVLIKVTSCGICGSDIGIWNGTNSLATYPRIIGHEFGGIVQEVGKAVCSVRKGDKVSVDPVKSCGKCYACRIGRYNVCEKLSVMGVHEDGGFCEYVCVPEANVHKFHTDFPEDYLSVTEPFSVGAEVNRRGQIGRDDKVFVMGAGPIGIAVMQTAKKNGADVIISDLTVPRLEKAKKMGADEVIFASEDDVEKKLLEFTYGEGIPVIVDTVCIPSSLEEAVKLACPAGRVVVLGLKDRPSNIAMVDITKKELDIVGSRLNCNCFEEVIENLESGKLKYEEYVTHIFPVEKVEKAFEMIQNYPQDVLKVILKF